MANKKYKLTDGNYWATDGVYDFDQGKTQREVNSDLSGATKYILSSTGTQANRSQDIQDYLNNYGCCILGTGVFYISAGINMPDNSCLIGMGNETVIRLVNSSTSEYAIKCGSFCNIENLKIIGWNTALPYEAYSRENRNGILLLGDAVSTSDLGTTIKNFVKISNVTITDFKGSGIRAYRNDGIASILGTNIDILRCHTGVNIELFSEFHSFSNLRVRNANIGLINNGGNNTFSACHITSCLKLLEIKEPTGETFINDSHSCFSGCTFAHSQNNTGFALDIDSVHNMLTFVGCEIAYGKIQLRWSIGVSISGCIILGCPEIIVYNSPATKINNNIFDSAPTFTVTNTPTFQFDENTLKNGSHLTVSGSMKTLEQEQIDTLSAKFGYTAFKAYAIPANGSKTLTYASETNQGLWICCGAYNEAKGLIIVTTNSSGTVHAPLTLANATGITVTNSSNTAVVANSTSSNCVITYMLLAGSFPTMT